MSHCTLWRGAGRRSAGASSSCSKARRPASRITDGRRGGRCWSGGTPRLPRACQLL